MKQKRGQTTVEMAFLLPLMVMMIGAAMFILYVCWQGIRTQQAANLAARGQGQERVAGGTSLGGIDQDNGNTASALNTDVGVGFAQWTPSARVNAAPTPAATGGGLSGKINDLVRALFPGTSSAQAYLQPPVIGQNVDTVSVVRVVTMPRIPFMNDPGTRPQITIHATSYGGEDTFMYGLPRWGRTASSSDAQWKDFVGQKGDRD